jgi:hypothetical protein
MHLSIRDALIGIVVIAGSFWVTLRILDYAGTPPSEQVAATKAPAPSAPAAPAAPTPSAAPTTPAAPAPAAPASPAAPAWNEALYLAVNADVAAAVARKVFKSGREHYEAAGRAERRQGGFVPLDWNEGDYLRVNPDVATAISNGMFISGYHHYIAAGKSEARRGGFPPGRPPDK